MPFIKISDLNIFYRVVVDGHERDNIDSSMPSMLVLHGGPGIVDHQIEFDAWSAFSDKKQVVFSDQRGCGKTDDGDPSKWNLLQCGKDIKSFFDETKIKNPLVAGTSWGGYVAMSYATQFPEDPVALILANSQARIDLTAKKLAYQLAFNKLGISFTNPPYNELGNDKEIVIDRVSEIACEYNRSPTNNNTALFLKFCAPLFSKGAFELKNPHRINMAIHKNFVISESLTMDFRPKLHLVKCPVLQIAGDRDPVHPAVTGKETALCFPNAKFVLIDDAGASVHKDQPEEFSKIVRGFLDDLASIGI